VPLIATAILGVELTISLETLLFAAGAFLTGGGSLLSGFAAVLNSYKQGIKAATEVAAAAKGT
jgi:hypothetical protein